MDSLTRNLSSQQSCRYVIIWFTIIRSTSNALLFYAFSFSLLSTTPKSQMNIRQIFYIYRKNADCPFSLISQSTARKNELPLDRMSLACDVTKKVKEEMQSPPREGAYVHGLFMEGARSVIWIEKLSILDAISIWRFNVGKWNQFKLLCRWGYSIFVNQFFVFHRWKLNFQVGYQCRVNCGVETKRAPSINAGHVYKSE